MRKENQSNLQITFDAVSTRHLHAEVSNRLHTAQRKSSLQDNFQQVSHKKSDAMLAGMFINMLVFGAMFHGMEEFLGLDNIVPDGAFSAMAEVATELRNEKFDGKGAFLNKIEGYPEGRRNDPMASSRTRKEFNLVSNNDNDNFEADTQAEIQCLAEMLTMIELAEKNGQTEMKVAKGHTVQAALRANALKPGFMGKLALAA